MGKGLPRIWLRTMGLAVWAGLSLAATAVQAQSTSSGNPFKDGWDKLSGAFSSKKAPTTAEPLDDSVSLNSRARPTANTYVAIARLYEQSGKLAEAEKQYQVALKENPKDMAAMLGYARLKERQGKPDEAVAMYQKTAKTFPQEAAVFNNLGLCHARRGTFDEAITALGRATLLQPKNVLYRNNMATVLVEMNRMQEAYSHLRVVHSEPACYYNIGFLLNKKGKTQDAAQHFAMAYQLDPSMTQAKEWLERLGAPVPQPKPSMMAPRQSPPPPVQQRSRSTSASGRCRRRHFRRPSIAHIHGPAVPDRTATSTAAARDSRQRPRPRSAAGRRHAAAAVRLGPAQPPAARPRRPPRARNRPAAAGARKTDGSYIDR